MGWSKVLIFAALLVLLAACSDDISSPVGHEFPTKLYPYEVTYDAATYRQRRDNLVQRIPSGSLILLTTNSVYLRNGDVNYDFRPSSVFYYLTGFDEPNAVAVIRETGGAPSSSQLVMFVEQRSGSSVQWLGSVYGPEGAVTYFGADSAYGSSMVGGWLKQLLASGTVGDVYANLDDNDETRAVFTQAGGDTHSVHNVDSYVDEMRIIKDDLEMRLLQRAVDVSVQAFAEGIRSIAPLKYEYEVESVFDLVLRMNGCPRTAFTTIVASGPNSTTIHYTANKRQMVSGDLVMIDFGAEYGYYAGDVTRTVPVNGTFTSEQAAVYDIVSTSLDAVLAGAKPGVSFEYLSGLNVDILIEGLLQKGVITGTKSAIISSNQYRLYIPASLGHSIGLDVHDPWSKGNYNERILRENMVLAIEPHLYLGAGDLTVSPAYRGVCARIEEDIRITSTGCEILSASLPRKRAEIEAMTNK
jgi:Xaa-Pro aminopeptidase